MSSAAHPLPSKHRLSIHDFHRMGETGILHEDSRVELIAGEIIDMTPIGSRHAGTVKYLNRMLHRIIGERAIVLIQDPIILGEHSEPQPDVALLRHRNDLYRLAHPKPEDVLLIIEVAESSIRYDREVKIPVYAQHQIPEAWLIDLETQGLYVHRAPAGQVYQDIFTQDEPRKLTPQALPGLDLDLSGLFQF